MNTALKWEKKKTLDIGLDYAMFGGKLEFNADWYKAVSEDLLYSVPVPAEAGATNGSVTMNAATMENTGLEFALAWHDYGHELKYDISANMTLPKNKVTSLGMGESQRIDGDCITKVGSEVGQFYGYVYEGIFQNQDEIDNRINAEGLHVNQNGAQPGDVAYKDVNNDGEITGDDRTILGSGMPKVQFGLSFRLEYKGFDLVVYGTGTAGNKIANLFYQADGPFRNSLRYFYDNAWTESNKNTTVPSCLSVVNDWTYWSSSGVVFDGSYFKIKQIQLGYTLPKSLTQKAFINNARVFVSFDDYITFSKYPGADPETATMSSSNAMGLDNGSYPTTRKMVAGIAITF